APERPSATVLAVEDEANLLMGLKELLEIASEKYELNVLTAANGKQGLAVLKNYKPDLIISDIMMPEMDGFTFLKQVRQNPDWIQIPFIFLTAKGEHHDIHRGLSSGAEIYITKPYDSDELLQLVTVQIEHYFQMQEMANQNFDSLKRNILQLITPDFRLPLSAVQTYSQALAAGMENVHSDAELKRSLRGIHEGSVRLTTLVEDFISLAELKTGETATAYALRQQPIFHPDIMLREIIQSCEQLARQRNISIQCDLAENLPAIYGDSETLRDGLKRLIEFAIKLNRDDVSQNLILSASSIGDEVFFQLDLPSTMTGEHLDKLYEIMTGDDLETLEMSDYAPSLTIARSYILLNNGRIQLSPDINQIVISFPVYTPAKI
ncbi:MAG: response regulator, partial [Anaerolineae bacterium]